MTARRLAVGEARRIREHLRATHGGRSNAHVAVRFDAVDEATPTIEAARRKLLEALPALHFKSGRSRVEGAECGAAGAPFTGDESLATCGLCRADALGCGDGHRAS